MVCTVLKPVSNCKSRFLKVCIRFCDSLLYVNQGFAIKPSALQVFCPVLLLANHTSNTQNSAQKHQIPVQHSTTVVDERTYTFIHLTKNGIKFKQTQNNLLFLFTLCLKVNLCLCSACLIPSSVCEVEVQVRDSSGRRPVPY